MGAELEIAPKLIRILTKLLPGTKDAGLGEEFLSSIDACIEGIRRFPEMHEIVYKNYRRALVRRFPYAIFYEYANSVVTIYCVFHTARDPAKWRQRLS